jgi:hypothetical protein
LIALPRFVREEFDVMLEDNVRAPIEDIAERCWKIIQASHDWSAETGCPCHMRYFGWLGSVPNLRWMYDSHIQSRGHVCHGITCAVFPFPTQQDIQVDLEMKREASGSKRIGARRSEDESDEGDDAPQKRVSDDEREPGGNAVWGSYGYYLSREGYEMFLSALQNDVGAMLRKGKRARHYTVKPIDKILPRLILEMASANNNPHAVHLPSHPAVFRAPMLASRIHAKYDPEFCKSTSYQLDRTGLAWADLWLSPNERDAVRHRERTGSWIPAVADPVVDRGRSHQPESEDSRLYASASDEL